MFAPVPESPPPPLGTDAAPVLARPRRASALQIAGSGPADPSCVHCFRLPCPPTWDDRPLGGRALHRRMRKAYFAVLDGMRSGRAAPTLDGSLLALLKESRSRTANAALRQLQRALAAVRRAGGAPLLRAPAAPLTSVTVTTPPLPAVRHGARPHHSADALESRYAWALEWLRIHRFTAGKGLSIGWREDPVL